MSNETEKDWVEEIGGPQYRSVEELVATLNLDWDRLEALRELVAARLEPLLDEPLTAEEREFAELIEAAGECESRDEARERIQQDALSVEVRSGWYTPVYDSERPAAEEFNILLCTGGPAARIRGELDGHGEPTRAWLEVQDWGKPWTPYFKASQDVLLAYAGCFYFGEGG